MRRRNETVDYRIGAGYRFEGIYTRYGSIEKNVYCINNLYNSKHHHDVNNRILREMT